MNKTIYLIILLLSFKICNAQTYYPFQTANATWSVVEYGYGTFPPETGTWHFGLAGDTVINGFTYHKIYVNAGSLGFINPEPAFNLLTAAYYGAFREDAAKKIWFRLAPDTTDILTYDFALNTGDTFCFDYQPCGVLCHPVSLIDSILISGNYRRQIHFDYGGQSEVWIEGIGSAFDNWIGKWCFIGNIAWELNCYKENGIPVYGPCNYPTSVNEISELASLKLFPNPFTNKLTITVNNNELTEIIIYDITSGGVLQQQFTNVVSLNTEQLSKGIYIYEVHSRNGLSQKGKVVKD